MNINELKNNFSGGLSRLFAGFILGSGMVGLLFWMMQAMIKMADVKEVIDSPIPVMQIVDVKRDYTPAEKHKRIVEPPRPDQPPIEPAPPKIDNPNVTTGTIKIATAQVKTEIHLSLGGFTLGAISDGEYLPIVKIKPIYPHKASERGIEGHCTVLFTVTKQGTTAHHRIDERNCTSRLFHKATINAAKKFKYKPTVRNGEAIDVANVKNLFRYSLDD